MTLTIMRYLVYFIYAARTTIKTVDHLSYKFTIYCHTAYTVRRLSLLQRQRT